jgi:hypothetical protein
MAGWPRLASPATWAIVLGGLAALSFAVMIPLTFLSGQVFSGALPLVIGVPCAGSGHSSPGASRATRSGGCSW